MTVRETDLDYSPSARALQRRAVAGALAAAPAVYFVAANLLKEGLGIGAFYEPIAMATATPDAQRLFNAVTPFVFVGGLVAGWALNFYPLVRLRARRARTGIVGHLRVHLRPANLLVAMISGGTFAILMLYLVLENFTHARRIVG